MSALQDGDCAKGAAAKIERHRQAFDAWLQSGLSDVEVLKSEKRAARKRHAEKIAASEKALFSLVTYHPTTLSEISAIAAHLSVHHRLEHFDRDVIQQWLESLSLCYGEGQTARAGATINIDAVNKLNGAHSDCMAVVQTLREALQPCMDAPNTEFPNPFSSERLYLTLGVVVDLLSKASRAADSLSCVGSSGGAA